MATQTLYQQVDWILQHFDFERVRLHMENTGHAWYHHDGKENRVPTFDELRDTARYLLYKAMDAPEETTCMGTGGFYVYKMPWGLTLHFVLESSSGI